MKYGHFDDEAREYVVTRPDTPRPWSNYLGTTEYGAIITNHAGGYSFYKSAARHRFLRLRGNSVPLDQPGRYFYLRDRSNGDRRVEIVARRRGGSEVQITVEDTGPGISADRVERIFQPFETDKATKAMGLALAVCRSLGLSVTPYPVDFRQIRNPTWLAWLPSNDGPELFVLALHEVMGRLVYRLRGWAH